MRVPANVSMQFGGRSAEQQTSCPKMAVRRVEILSSSCQFWEQTRNNLPFVMKMCVTTQEATPNVHVYFVGKFGICAIRLPVSLGLSRTIGALFSVGVRGCADSFSNIFQSDILECPSLLRRACSVGSRNMILKLCHMDCYFSWHLD